MASKRISVSVDMYTWARVERLAKEKGMKPEAIAAEIVTRETSKIFCAQGSTNPTCAHEVQPTRKGA